MEKYQVGLDRKEELTDKNCTKAEEFSSCRNGVNRKEEKTGESISEEHKSELQSRT